MNKDKKITRFSQCSDPEGYKKKDREWIDLYIAVIPLMNL